MEKFSRGQSKYWQMLRKDKASAIACVFLCVSVIATTLSWIGLLFEGTHYQVRGNIFYWMIMIPGMVWFMGVADYGKWSSYLIPVAMIFSPFLCFLSYYYEIKKYLFDHSETRLMVSLVLVAFSILSYIFYRRSMLYREGPFTGQP